MGIFDNPSDDEEQDDSNDGDSGTYIQFISGPGHRDWKESWSDDAKSDISRAYELAAPNGDSGVVNQFANSMCDDRHHFYAVVTLALGDIFENQDFQQMLDLLMGSPESEETVELYADQLEEFLESEPEVAAELLERVNVSEEAAPADD